MKEGHKLYVTAQYAFNYDDSHYEHLYQIDILTQFFEHRCNLKGFISDEEGDRVVPGSEVDILMEDFHKGFDNRNIPEVVERYLHDYEMYEMLAEYNSPLEGVALQYKEDLIKEHA